MVTGKVGTDIEENKCSWLVVQALQRVDPKQRKILQVNPNLILESLLHFGGTTSHDSVEFLSNSRIKTKEEGM